MDCEPDLTIHILDDCGNLDIFDGVQQTHLNDYLQSKSYYITSVASTFTQFCIVLSRMLVYSILLILLASLYLLFKHVLLKLSKTPLTPDIEENLALTDIPVETGEPARTLRMIVSRPGTLRIYRERIAPKCTLCEIEEAR